MIALISNTLILYLIYMISFLIINADELYNIIYLQYKFFVLNNTHILIHT